MFFIENRRSVRELESILAEMRINLQNNYKSLAHAARQKLGERTEQLFKEGKLSEKNYKKYIAIYTEYTAKLYNYRH
jgi:hypothetical protein